VLFHEIQASIRHAEGDIKLIGSNQQVGEIKQSFRIFCHIR